MKEEQETTNIQIPYSETFNRFNTKDSYIGNMTHIGASTAGWNLSFE
jgi:hypothetical protein